MPSVLGSAVLNLTTDATKLSRGLRQAEVDTDRSLTKMQRLGDVAAKAAPYAAIGAAAVGAGVGLKALVDDVANVERELRPFLQRSNLTVESLQQWQEIGRRLGAEDPLEGITDSIQEFKLRLGELVTDGTGPLETALPALGLALQDLQGKTPEEQFRALLTALQAVDDETRRLYLADELFGGAMENIIGILQAQRAEFEAVEQAVRNTHNVLSGEELQKLKDYNQAVDEIGNTWDSLKQDLVTGVAPALAGFFGILSDEIEYQKGLWSDGADHVVNWSETALDAIKMVGPGMRVGLEPIPGIIGDVMTDEEADIAGYIGNQLPAIKDAFADITTTARIAMIEVDDAIGAGWQTVNETVNNHLIEQNSAIRRALETTVTNVRETADQLVEIDTLTATQRLTVVTKANQAFAEARAAAQAEEVAAAQANADRIEQIIAEHTRNWVSLAAAGRSQDRANATAWANHVAAEANRAASAAVEAARQAAEAIRGFDSAAVQGAVDQYDMSQWERYTTASGEVRYRSNNPNARVRDISEATYRRFRRRAAESQQRAAITQGGLYGQTYAGEETPTLYGLPSMDSGGIVTGPTLAALAMNSRPEAVIPLDRMGGMGTTIVFEGPVYGMDDFRDKVQEATLLGNRQGRQEVLYGAR